MMEIALTGVSKQFDIMCHFRYGEDTFISSVKVSIVTITYLSYQLIALYSINRFGSRHNVVFLFFDGRYKGTGTTRNVMQNWMKYQS